MPFVVTFHFVCKHNIHQNATRCLPRLVQTPTIPKNDNTNSNIIVLLKLKFNH